MSNTPSERPSPPNLEPSQPIQPTEEEQPHPGESFKTFMEEPEGKQSPGQAKEPSPFDLAGQGGKATPGPPSAETLLGQMNSTSSVLGDLQTQLNTKNLKLRPSQKYLLRNKLSDANKNIRKAATATGAEVDDPPPKNSRQTPIAKFLGLVLDGQNQLSKAQGMIQKMNTTGASLNPGQLLSVQVKLATAQRSLEYSSILLSKAVDNIKTLFNIQL